MFVNLLDMYKGKTHKYTHKKRVFVNGKPSWKYYYKEHHGGGVTNVKDLKEGDAFKVNYKGQEGHFHVKKTEDNKVTVVHDETGKETILSKSELRQVLLKTHATALKENVEKKKQTLAKRKSAKAKERAQQALDRAKSKIDGLEQDNFETMPEQEKQTKEKENVQEPDKNVEAQKKNYIATALGANREIVEKKLKGYTEIKGYRDYLNGQHEKMPIGLHTNLVEDGIFFGTNGASITGTGYRVKLRMEVTDETQEKLQGIIKELENQANEPKPYSKHIKKVSGKNYIELPFFTNQGNSSTAQKFIADLETYYNSKDIEKTPAQNRQDRAVYMHGWDIANEMFTEFKKEKEDTTFFFKEDEAGELYISTGKVPKSGWQKDEYKRKSKKVFDRVARKIASKFFDVVYANGLGLKNSSLDNKELRKDTYTEIREDASRFLRNLQTADWAEGLEPIKYSKLEKLIQIQTTKMFKKYVKNHTSQPFKYKDLSDQF